MQRLIPILVILISLWTTSCGSSSNIPEKDFAREAAVQILNAMQEKDRSLLPVLIHGAGEGEWEWTAEMAEATGGAGINWEPYARDRMKAPEKGYSLGLRIGEYLKAGMEEAAIDGWFRDQQLMLIAHSAGAWLAQGIIDAGGNDPWHIHSLVLLDPFTARSLFQPWAGRKILGGGLPADKIEIYFTTTDPIPFTNGKCKQGIYTDLTEMMPVPEEEKEAHWQVIGWYFEHRFHPPAGSAGESP